MQTPDAPDHNAEYFIAQVKRRTGGRVTIGEGTDYSSVNPENEARLVRALRNGRAQLAYIPSRAWERASPVRGFRALQAPFLVVDYGLLRRIATGSVGRSMLRGLGPIGVVGLALVPDELRRPLGRRPLATPDAFRGARIRVVTSPTGELALGSLGAVPLTNFTSRAVGPALSSGRLIGVETSINSIAGNGYVRQARYLTGNLALFSKMQTIAVRKAVFDRLSAADRAALRAAAAATVAHADPAAQERAEVRQLCHQGLRVVDAGAADVASLRRLAASAYPVLERDPTTRKEIHAIDELRRDVSGASAALPACSSTGARSAGTSSTGPSGTYVLTASQPEVASAPGSHGATDNWGSFRLVMKNGRFRLSDRRPAGALVEGASRGSSTGTYAVHGDRITFTAQSGIGDVPLGQRGDQPVICRWSLFRSSLAFRQLPAQAQQAARGQGLDPGGPPALYVKPWRRAG